MKRSIQLSFAFCTFLVVAAGISSCKSEDQINYAEKILGRWDIREAKRNGDVTESLAGLYFEFQADGAMRTNLSATEETAAYEVRDNKILQRQSQIEADYTIEEISDSTMILTTTLRSYNFRFSLTKAGE
ncbi:MAG: hypothetical protein HUU01_03320 [Saprospiraceae bacterium]|nr:hypothetical protein [Saprospiraceae bacterium]